jgi:iron-sulfur cluster insertion protein
MSDDVALPLEFTEAAANKVKHLIADEDNPNLKLRVYITGGGCSGFQYGFTFDDQVNEGDMTIEKQGVGLVVDPMSLQYLVGGSVDYTEGLEGSRFIVTNPNAKSTCGCGPRSALIALRGVNPKNGNLKVTVLLYPTVIIQRKRRQLQMPADGRQTNHQRDHHPHHRRIFQREMKGVVRRGVDNAADDTGRGVDFGTQNHRNFARQHVANNPAADAGHDAHADRDQRAGWAERLY